MADKKRSVRVDWEDLRVLVELANQGSLSGAARVLGVTHVTVSRRIANLEADLGQPMFTREAGRYVLTDQGRRITELAGPMSESASAIVRAAAGLTAKFAGPVRVTATEAVCLYIVMPGIKLVTDRYPDLEMTLHISQLNLNLARHDADIAVRLAKPEQGTGIIGPKVATLDYHLYASKDYVAAKEPDDYEYIGYTQEFAGWQEAQTLGTAIGERRLVLRLNHLSNRIEAARLGIGAALLPDMIAERVPELMRVTEGPALMQRDIYVLVHEDMKSVPRIRACTDVLIESIREMRGIRG